MKGFSVEIELTADCSCGNSLSVTDKSMGCIEVEPCEDCMDTTDSRAYKKGHDAGYEEGLKDA